MTRITTILLAGGLFLPCASFAAPPVGYTVATFSDEFNGAGVDSSQWTIDPNRPNVSVTRGMLTLTTEDLGSSWQSGQVWSSHTQRYGYWEARFTIGEEAGLNNAFWLNTPHGLIQEEGNVSGTQTVDRMEVDIQELHYPDELNMNLHDWAPTHVGKGSSSQHVGGDLSKTFHTYGMEWRSDNSMAWYFDGVEKFSHSTDAVNSIRNMIPLETLFSTLVTPFAGSPGPNLDGTTMDVDWVRVWQKPGWTGTANGNWDSASNWGPDGAPGMNDAAIFNQPSANTTISLAADKSLREVYFRGASTPAFTFAAGSTLHLGAVSSASGVGGVTIDGDVTSHQTFDVAIAADADLMFGNYSRTPGVEMRLNGGLTAAAAGAELFFGNYEEQPILVNGSIGGRFSRLTKFKTGTLTLAGANAYAGLTDVRNGVLTVAADGALGAVGGNNFTQIDDGATIRFVGGVQHTAAESIHISGHGAVGATGALEVGDRSSVAHHGPVWLAADATVSSGPVDGTLTLAGPIGEQGGSRQLRISGGGSVRIEAASTFTGETNVTSGTLALAGAGSLASSSRINLLANAVLDVSAVNGAPYALAAGQSLSGTGVVVGSLTAASGATLDPGAAAGFQTLILTADHDVRLRSGQGTQGGGNLLAVGPVKEGDDFRTVLEFPPAVVPGGATLVDVSLTLAGGGGDGASVSTAPVVGLYDLTQSFDEGEASWANATIGVPWIQAGGALGGELAATVGHDPDTWSSADTMHFTGSALDDDVAAHAALGEPARFAIKTDTEGSGERSFFWIAADETGSRPGPVLSVRYATPEANTLSVQGDYVQQAGATLAIDAFAAAGGAYDALAVSGAAELHGEVQLSLLDGYTPQIGDRLDIVTAASVVSGGLSLIGDAVGFELRVTPTSVSLLYLDGATGDYNADGVVDSADYTIWRDALGATGPHPADGNRNNVVDQGDYDLWLLTYGTNHQYSNSFCQCSRAWECVVAVRTSSRNARASSSKGPTRFAAGRTRTMS